MVLPEKLLKRFRDKWGDKFDYSKSEYVSYKTKILIYCKEHDEWFWQTPETHLKFNGCKKCSAEFRSGVRRMNEDVFILRCKEIYGDRFGLEEVKYVNNHTMIDVICPKHGKFSVSPTRFLDGCGCKFCNTEKPNKRIKPFEDVLKRFREIHGDKYEYDETTYVKASDKIRIICPKHGEFWQSPNKHLSGQGCPLCGNDRISDKERHTADDFIRLATLKHGNKYDYSKVVYTRNSEKVEIICHEKDENGMEHGSFYQAAGSHLNGCGCPKCAKEERIKKETKPFTIFVEEANKIHGDKGYIYDETTYKNRNTEMRIVCPIHGEFWQKPSKHLRGHGCPKCAKSGIPFSSDEYFEKANEVHDGKYNYDESEFTRTKDKIKIICPIHGEFWQEAESHLNGHGCPKCANVISIAENEITDFLTSILGGDEIINREREILDGKEIDILIPKLSIGIEYNGLYWHSDKFNKDTYYHLNKTEDAAKNGIRLIQIFEDEWCNKKEIVKSKLKHIIGKDYDLPRIMARKCEVREIPPSLSFSFLEENHIQGKAYATVHLGAFYGDRLVAVMLFKKDGLKDGHWELNRYASDINFRCQGLGSKLFSYFVKKYEPEYIKSFADRRWTLEKDGNFYTAIGFELDDVLGPDYRYYLNGKTVPERIHKFNFRKQILHKKYGLDLSLTESKMAEAIGAYKIWDCGLLKYVWKKKV